MDMYTIDISSLIGTEGRSITLAMNILGAQILDSKYNLYLNQP